MRPAPTVPVSWGELIDKITILEIKASKLTDAAALKAVTGELVLLSGQTAGQFDSGDLLRLKTELKFVNEELWQIEDHIREKEAASQFDDGFVALARSVYRRNDRRAEIKREINQMLASELVEIKIYKPY
jgi:hypothetical protein